MLSVFTSKSIIYQTGPVNTAVFLDLESVVRLVWSMVIRWKKRSYTLFSLLTTLFEEAVIAVVVLLILPRFGISIPVWLLILLMVIWAAYSFITFRLGEKVISRTPLVGPDTLIGARGKTTTPLSPAGYVQIGNELWRARSLARDVAEKTEVTVIGINRLTLFVVPEEGDTSDKSDNS